MPAPQLGLTARATVDRVVDGDTVDLVMHIPVRIRMRDCWAPEVTGQEKLRGEAAKSHLETMAPQGSRVRLHVATDGATAVGDILTFGRVVGDIWREGDDDSLNQLMVAAGHATEEKP